MSAYSDRVIADGASNYWRLDEAAGLTAVDIVGGKSGTLSGGVALGQAGALGGDDNRAMLFDGVDGKMATAANVTISLLATIELWFKTTASIPSYRFLFSTRGSGSGNTCYIAMKNGGADIVFGSVAEVGLSDAAFPTNDGLWHYLVITLDGVNCNVYLDGVLRNSAAHGRTVPGTSLLLLGVDGATYFNVALDDVAIYPRPLTAAEITAHHRAGLYSSTIGRPETWPPELFDKDPNLAIPVLNALIPATALRSLPSVPMTVVGTQLGDDATIIWNGVPQPTAFVVWGKLTTTVAIPAQTGPIPVQVRSATGLVSPALNFTVT